MPGDNATSEEQLRSSYRFDTERRRSLTFPCALKAPAGSREGPSPLSYQSINGTYNPVLPVCEPQAQAWRSYVRPATRSSESRTTEETSQVAASRRAGRMMQRRCERFAALPAFAKKSAAELAQLGLALHDAQSVIAREHGFAVVERACAKKSRRARCRSTPPSTSSSVARREARRAAPSGCSRCIPASRRRRCRRRSCSATSRAVEARLRTHPELATQPGGPQQLGAAALRVPHLHARRHAAARETASSQSRDGFARARRESERRVSLELASGAAAHRVVGGGLRRQHTCRWRRCCSRPARIPPTA